jgi:hypothetical protein
MKILFYLIDQSYFKRPGQQENQEDLTIDENELLETVINLSIQRN